MVQNHCTVQSITVHNCVMQTIQIEVLTQSTEYVPILCIPKFYPIVLEFAFANAQKFNCF